MTATLSLAHRYVAAHPRAAALRVKGLPPEDVAALVGGLEPEIAAPVLKELWPDFASEVLGRLEPKRAAQIVEQLELTKTVMLLSRLSAEVRERVLQALPRPLERRVRSAIALPAGTAGSVADTSVIPFDADMTVAEARSRVDDPRFPYVYVVDRELRLVGVVHRRELAAQPDAELLRSLMKTRIQSITAADSMAVVHQHGAWADLDALPVVDDHGAFIGVIRHKMLRAAPSPSRGAAGSETAMSALLDLGEVYWSSLFSAIEALSTVGSEPANGGAR